MTEQQQQHNEVVAAGWVYVDNGLFLPPKQPGMRGWTDASAYTLEQAFTIVEATRSPQL